jgi:pimeloyl-ACP methyl ester carboxylesterase
MTGMRVAAVLVEENVTAAATALSVPTLLYSGGLSPYLTQRIVGRLASIIAGVTSKHVPAAGHVLQLSQAKVINPDIVAHIIRADDLARASIVSPPEAADDALTNGN